MHTHIIVSVLWEVDVCFLVLHVDDDSLDLRQHVLVVPEVCQQVHDGVADLLIHRLPEPHADQGTRVV